MAEAKSGRLDVVLCRGCCCGTDKHPDIDHQRQLDTVAAAVETLPAARMVVADCLNRCDFSNVAVVRHRPAGGGKRRTFWLGDMLEETDTAELCRFLTDLSERERDPEGYPVPLPARLERRRIDSPREAREALNDLIVKR